MSGPEPLRPTTGRWYNDFSESKQGPGGEWIIKPPKKLAHRGSYDQFRYGHDHPSTWRLSHLQRCQLCCPASMAIGVDVDYPELFAATRTARLIGRAQAISTRGGRYHVLVDARGWPLTAWPRQTPIAGADIKSRGFIPLPGCLHYSGQLYQPVPGAVPVPWSPGLIAAIQADQADERARRKAELDRFLASHGLPPLPAGYGGRGGGHDDEVSAACMGMILLLAQLAAEGHPAPGMWSTRAGCSTSPGTTWAKLVDAFRDQAYDAVSFQLAPGDNQHTNDPERHRGQITDLELAEDGLWMYLNPTEAGEQVLRDNPMLGVSARIVENYNRSDGKFYPAAIQHVLGTLDPRIPALGQWQPVEMSNSGGQVVVDLSASSWAGEPGPPDPADAWDDLSDTEIADFFDALADAEEADAASSALEQFDGTFTETYQAEAAREQARQAADMDDLISPARTDEDIVARAIARASAGIYDTSRVSAFASPSTDAIELSTDLTMATGLGICGNPDDFGRCGAPHHKPYCRHNVGVDWQASGPPRSTYAMALSNFADGHDTGGEPGGYGDDGEQHPIPQGTLERAHALNQSWHLAAPDPVTADDLFGSGSYAGNAYAALAAEAGFRDLELPQRPDYPDVSAIRAGLGI